MRMGKILKKKIKKQGKKQKDKRGKGVCKENNKPLLQ